MSVALRPGENRHGLLPKSNTCYNCGVDIRYYVGKDRGKGYCSVDCMKQRPPKMVLAEMAWGRPFVEMALEHLNRGGSINALAEMCGVHRQAVYAWLKLKGIRKVTKWTGGGTA